MKSEYVLPCVGIVLFAFYINLSRTPVTLVMG